MTKEKPKYIEAYFYSKSEIKSVSQPDLSVYNNPDYYSLSDRAGLIYCLDKDRAEFLNGCNVLIDDLLPDNIYKIKIENNENVKDYNGVLSEQESNKLTLLFSMEHKQVSRKHQINLDSNGTIKSVIYSIGDFFGRDRSFRLLEKLGIHALKMSDGIRVISDDIKCEIDHQVEFNKKIRFTSELNDIVKRIPIDKEDDTKSLKDKLNILLNNFSLVFINSALNNKEVFDILRQEINNGHGLECSEEYIRDILTEINKNEVIKFTKENPKDKGVLSRLFNVIFQNNNIVTNVILPKTIQGIEEFHDRRYNLGGVNNAAKRIINEETNQSFVFKELETEEACKSEFEAYKIYEAFGVEVPEAELVEEDGITILLTEFIDGISLHGLGKVKNRSYLNMYELDFIRKEIASNFVIDAIMGNYDSGSHHLGNLIYLPDENKIKRIDPGAALAYTHDGKLKNIETDCYSSKYLKWSSESVIDYFSLIREGAYNSSEEAIANYSNITNEEILNDLYASELCLPKVKKVASPENYKIIEERINIAIDHFENLIELEQDINNEAPKSSFFDYGDRNLGFSDIVMGSKKSEIKL